MQRSRELLDKLDAAEWQVRNLTRLYTQARRNWDWWKARAIELGWTNEATTGRKRHPTQEGRHGEGARSEHASDARAQEAVQGPLQGGSDAVIHRFRDVFEKQRRGVGPMKKPQKYEFKNLMHLYSSELVDPFHLLPEDIDIRDIAHALARICRYGGHVRSYYSVAEHSVRVSEIAEQRYGVLHGGGCGDGLHYPTDMGKYGLLHDGSEAYLGDVIRGIKKRPEMEWYKVEEKKLERKILDKFGLSGGIPELVHEIDLELCGTEMRQLLFHAVDINNTPLRPSIPGLVVGLWSPEEAETRFLARYQELFQ